MAHKDEYGETNLEDAEDYGVETQSDNTQAPDNAGLIGRKLKPGMMPPVEDKAPIKTVETA